MGKLAFRKVAIFKATNNRFDLLPIVKLHCIAHQSSQGQKKRPQAVGLRAVALYLFLSYVFRSGLSNRLLAN
jgi:hypothetical protein